MLATRPRPRTVELTLPVKGIDQSAPYALMMKNGLTYSALNVRSFPSYKDQAGIGKRDGTRRLFTTQAVKASQTRILGLAITTAAAVDAQPAQTQTLRPDATVSQTALLTGVFFASGVAGTTVDDALDATGEPDDDLSYAVIACSTSITEFTVGIDNPSSPPAVEMAIKFRVKMILDPSPPTGTGFGSVVVHGQSGEDMVENVEPTSLAARTGEPPVADGSGEICLNLLELANGLIATTGFVVPAQIGVWQDFSYTLSAAELAVIVAGSGDYNNLRLQCQCSVGNRQFAVTEAKVVMQTAVLDPSPATTKVLALINDGAFQGTVATDTFAEVTYSVITSSGLVNALPSIAEYAGSWYIVDGGAARIVDSSTATMSAFTASPGTLPSNLTQIAAYRGRLVASKGVSWYMSRRFAPLDWDFGSDNEEPGATAAIAGTNKFLGQPADPIVALVPAFDDYLFFFCTRSIWVLAGDPGFQGSFDNVTNAVGIMGSRAWCFDDAGNLWFLGAGGLYMIPRGTATITPVAHGRLTRFLERVNLDEILVQLAYDASRKEVMVFLTPADGVTNGRHAVYVVPAQAVWRDQYLDDSPNMGPWSCCPMYAPGYGKRRFIFGGDDGYIRHPDDTALGDDVLRTDLTRQTGLPITSVVDILAEFGTQTEPIITQVRGFGPGVSQEPLSSPLGRVDGTLRSGDDMATVQQSEGADTIGSSWSWFDPIGRGNRVQAVELTGVPSGGTLTLTFGGHTTGSIAYDASAAVVFTALTALPTVAPQDVKVTGGPWPSAPIYIEFRGFYAGKTLSLMSGTSSLTGGTAPAISIYAVPEPGLQPAIGVRQAGWAHRLTLREKSRDRSWAVHRIEVDVQPSGRRR